LVSNLLNVKGPRAPFKCDNRGSGSAGSPDCALA